MFLERESKEVSLMSEKIYNLTKTIIVKDDESKKLGPDSSAMYSCDVLSTKLKEFMEKTSGTGSSPSSVSTGVIDAKETIDALQKQNEQILEDIFVGIDLVKKIQNQKGDGSSFKILDAALIKVKMKYI